MVILHRIPSIVVLAWTLALASAKHVWNHREPGGPRKEDTVFWDRFLQDDASSIVGTVMPESPGSGAPIQVPSPSLPTGAPFPLPLTFTPTTVQVPLPSATTGAPFQVPSTLTPTTVQVPLPSATTGAPFQEPSTLTPTTVQVPLPSPTTDAPFQVPSMLTPTAVQVPLPSPTTNAPFQLPLTLAPTAVQVPLPSPTTGAPLQLPTLAPTAAQVPSPSPTTGAPFPLPLTLAPTAVQVPSPSPTTGSPFQSPLTFEPSSIQVPLTPAPVPAFPTASSSSPTIGTSAPPSTSGCFYDAMITCSDIRGVPCSQLLPPSGICSIGEEIVALTFAITSSTCEDSRTSQDQSFECQGVENLPREGTVVVVSCQDSSGQEFYNDTAPVGASVTIQGPAATGLPDVVTCIIANESTGNQLQSLTFDTSGSVDLLLRDKFGMMELISCDVSGQPLQNCNVPVLFSYELENNGALDLNVTSLTRIRDGQNASLIDSIERANPLSPGDIVSTTEAEDLDLCVDGAYQTTIIVGASQLAGEFCEFVATYGIDISSPCRIDIDIDCTSEDEIPCNQFPLLDTLCPTNLEFLTFKYLSSPCPGENGVTTCEDFNGGLVGGQISVSCAGSDGVSIGIPATVVNQDIFTIDLSGTSPTQLTCTLTSMDSTTLQVISLDLTDGSALTLTSIFGGLTLDGCGDAAGVALSCTTAVSWNFETINIGSNDLNLTSIEIVRDDGTIDLSEQIVNRFIAPGDSIHAKYEELVDRCMGLTTTARVSGEISGQVLCLSEEVYEFETISGPGSPTAGPVTSSPTAANTPVAPMPTPMAESTTAPSQTSVVSTISPTPSMPATPEEPSLAPSELPAHSSSPPTENCIVVEIDCLPPFEGANCNDIVVEIIECQEPPSEMVLRYNGGDCDGSFNIQPDTLFSCVDLQGGPPQEVGAVSYITARGLGENQEEYFSGFVAIGEDFVLSAQTVVTANMNIMIYDPSGSSNPDEITNSDGLVQNITMHTSCLNYLFLKDRFGAVQLVEFENSRQGRVTSYQNITLTYTIELARNQEEVSVELTGLTVTSNLEISEGETRDVSPAVIEKIVTPDMTVTIEEQYRIDLTQRKRYTTSAVVVGQADDGKICSGSESYQFTAGNPLPPIFPTLSPSSPPTISPFPTPDPLNATCEVQASIACALTSGRRCNLQAPAGSTCIGSDANFLQFMYAPDSFCNRTSTATNFICDDSNIDIERPQTVYIRIGRGDEEAWFSDVVSTGQVIDVSIPVGESMRIEISTDGGGVAGVLLQESLMSVTCVEESALTLLNYFGNLQLVGYQNLERGLQQVFANVEITYTATNVGALDMDLLGAFGSSPFTGFQQFLGAESQRLSRDESSSFVEEFTLNLAATAGSDFQFTFLAQGRGSVSQVGCDDTAAFTLAIQ